jgi:hypothetical protein
MDSGNKLSLVVYSNGKRLGGLPLLDRGSIDNSIRVTVKMILSIASKVRHEQYNENDLVVKGEVLKYTTWDCKLGTTYRHAPYTV